MKKGFILMLTAAVTGAVIFPFFCFAEEDAPNMMELLSEAGDQETEAEIVRDDFDTTEYLIPNASQYVELGGLEGLQLEKNVYLVTDDQVEYQIEQELQQYAAEEPVEDRPSEEGDTISGTLISDPHPDEEGETDLEKEEDPEFTFVIGEDDYFYGDGFSDKLTGLNVGDTVQFTMSFDEENLNWPDATVDFTLTVDLITRFNVPEYNETFVKETLGFESIEEYENYVRGTIEQDNENSSNEELFTTALDAAANACVFHANPDETEELKDLYEKTKNDILNMYSFFLGDEEPTEENIAALFGMSTDELADAIRYEVNLMVMESAYCEENNIVLSSDDYYAFLDEQAYKYGYADGNELEQESGRESMVREMYTNRMVSELIASAQITEVEVDADTEGEFFDDEEYDDEEEEDDLIEYEYEDDSEEFDEDDEYYADEDEEYELLDDDEDIDFVIETEEDQD